MTYDTVKRFLVTKNINSSTFNSQKTDYLRYNTVILIKNTILNIYNSENEFHF